jgi:photosystem II stability/assembly factor-like uncharacterized protein
MKPIAIILFFILTIMTLGQPSEEVLSWEQQVSGTNNMLTSVSFIDVDQGWIVGGNGTILHTNDGGLEWEPQASGTYNNLVKVTFPDAMHGWTCGMNGTILATNNGGQTWNSQVSGTTDNILSIYFVDLLHGWATSWCDIWPNFGNILHTNNGGQTWEVQNTGLNEWAMLIDICFTDTLNGWAGSFYQVDLVRTHDGGNTWEWVAGGVGGNDLQFLNQDIGFICGPSGIELTSDGGSTWTNRYTTSNGLNAICFTDNYYGYAVGNYGEFAKTTNGGFTWTNLNLEDYYTFQDISFPARDTGWIVGNNGRILHTTNGGFVNLQEPLITNHPNPFSHSTYIEYEIAQAGCVTLTVFNQSGQEVGILVDEVQMPGKHQAYWEATGLTEGIYFYRLTTGDRISTGKMILMGWQH